MLRYFKKTVICLFLLLYADVYPVENQEGENSYSAGSEIFEWGIYTSLYCGAVLLKKHGPLFDDPLIGGRTDKPYKSESTIPAQWLNYWTAGVYGYILMLPNNEGQINSITYNNIKGFYESIAYSYFITIFTKVTAGRKRPSYDDYPEKDKENDGRRSFISGHSSAAFVTAAYSSLYIAEHSGNSSDGITIALKTAAVTASFAAASYTAWSRVNDNRHRWSDVIAGAAAGAGSGVAGYMHQNGWLCRGDRKSEISIIPVLTEDGISAAVVKQF